MIVELTKNGQDCLMRESLRRLRRRLSLCLCLFVEDSFEESFAKSKFSIVFVVVIITEKDFHNKTTMRNTISVAIFCFLLIAVPTSGQEIDIAECAGRKCNNATLEVPICASNGLVYESQCLMLRENCTLIAQDWENCRGQHPLCPADCLDIQDPVCAEDGKVHPNKCVMHKRNCGKAIRERAMIFCLGTYRKSRAEKCPETCLELYKPVCGSDGQIYLNECYLRREACKSGVEKMDMAECVAPAACPSACIPIYDPVCGSNKQIYLNQCLMQKANCKAPVKQMALQFCVGNQVHKL